MNRDCIQARKLSQGRINILYGAQSTTAGIYWYLKFDTLNPY